MTGPRFAGLQDTLRAMSRPVHGERIAAILNAAKGGTTSPSPAPAVATRTAAVAPKPAVPAKAKAAEQPIAASWPVPSEVAAQGEAKAEAYRISFELVTDQLRRVAALPAAKGRVASVIEMVAAGADDAEIRAKIGDRSTDNQRAATRMWERAIKATCGSIVVREPADTSPEPRGAARQRMLAVARDPAFNGSERQALMLLTAPSALGLSAEDIVDVLATKSGAGTKAWDRAIAAVFPTT